MKLEKSNPDTAFLEQEVQYQSVLSQSGYIIQKQKSVGQKMNEYSYSYYWSVLQNLDYTVYKTEKTLLARPFIVQAVILHNLTAEWCNVTLHHDSGKGYFQVLCQYN